MATFPNAPKICLINPPTTEPDECGIYFPLCLITLGSVLKEHGFEAEIWDFDLHFKKVGNTDEARFRKLIRAGVRGANTRIFGITAICSNYPIALWIAKQIKEERKDAVVVFGGAQPSSVPMETLEKFPFVDAVVVGEGEMTLLDMARVGYEPSHFGDIPGVAFREGGSPRFTGARRMLPELDDLPVPDYSLVDLDQYMSLKPLVEFRPTLEAGRGCPFTCTFCSTALMWNRDYRVKSPDRILQEMTLLHEQYGFKEFGFIHDNFTTSKNFLEKYCDYMIENNRQGFRWHCSSRTDCLTVDRIQRMYDAGLSGLFFGIDSASERMQKVMQKHLNTSEFNPIIRKSCELKLESTTAFVLGFPEETEEDLDASVLLALRYREMGTPRVFFGKLCAYTGTAIHKNFLGRFRELSPYPSPCPQNYEIPYVKDLITGNPDFFSSFYHVPHPVFSSDYLCRYTALAYFLVDGAAQISLLLKDHLGIGITKLFKKWDEWASERRIPYYFFDYKIYGVEGFQRDFQNFLDETLFLSVTTRPEIAA